MCGTHAFPSPKLATHSDVREQRQDTYAAKDPHTKVPSPQQGAAAEQSEEV